MIPDKFINLVLF